MARACYGMRRAPRALGDAAPTCRTSARYNRTHSRGQARQSSWKRTGISQTGNTPIQEASDRAKLGSALACEAADDALAAGGRLVHELYDAVTQTLFSASLIAEALPALWESDPEEARQSLVELRQLSRGAIAEMRTLLLELSPSSLADADLGDLLHQLTEASAGRTNAKITVTARGLQPLPADVRIAFYRIAQEAINNAVKHAKASHVDLSLSRTATPPDIDRKPSFRVELCVSDNGRGFKPVTVQPGHHGLDIIRERANAIGAELTMESQPDQGTQIVVTWEERE